MHWKSVIRPNKTIEHTVTFQVLAGLGPETGTQQHQNKSTINTANTDINFFHCVVGIIPQTHAPIIPYIK